MPYGHPNVTPVVESLRRRTLDRKRWFHRLLDEQPPRTTSSDAARAPAPGSTAPAWPGGPAEPAAP